MDFSDKFLLSRLGAEFSRGMLLNPLINRAHVVLGLQFDIVVGQADLLRRRGQGPAGDVRVVKQARLAKIDQRDDTGIETGSEKQKFPDGIHRYSKGANTAASLPHLSRLIEPASNKFHLTPLVFMMVADFSVDRR